MEIEEAPDRQWQMETITDDFGGTISLTYATAQVGGRWVVESATLPGGGAVSYGYGSGRLASVTGADGAVSTFSVAPATNSNTDVLSIDDPAAGGTHRRKDVYLGRCGLTDYEYERFEVFTGSSQLVRAIVSGAGEVSFMAWDTPIYSSRTSLLITTYEGSGRARTFLSPGLGGTFSVTEFPADTHIHSDSGVISLKTPQGHRPTGSSTGVLQQAYIESHPGGNLFGWAPAATWTDPAGRTKTYLYDPAGWATRIVFDDDSFEAYCYDDDHRILRYRDRIGRVVRNVYDAAGNRVTRETGLTAPEPTGGDPYGGDPYGGDPYGGDPYGGDPYGGSFDFCSATLTQTTEYAVETWTYDGNGNVLTAVDALGRVTNYEYTNGRLTKIASPPDASGGPRAETTYVYHADGRLDTVFNSDGSGVSYDYDAVGRRVKTTYADGTTKEVEYATIGPDAGLVVKQIDRAGVVTELSYDASGRLTTRTEAAAVRDGSGNDAPTPAGTALVTSHEYLDGTNDIIRTVHGGNETLYEYDGQGRIVSSTVKPNATSTLTTAREYRDGQLFKTIDPYGRSTYHAYDACCGRKIRTVAGAVPAFTLADEAAVLTHTRDPDGTPNSTSLVSDVVYDAAGQVTSTVDPRGIAATYAHDSVGRRTVEIDAAGTPVESRTETDYDLVGNVVEVRSPRYFDAADAAGHQAARTTMTYTGRDLLATQTEAPGTAEAATVSYTYTLDGDLETKTDARGNVWTTTYDGCCDRWMSSASPLDDGSITGRDARGLLVYAAGVDDVSQQSLLQDPAAADTLSETTTRRDARGRPVAMTRWLVPRGSVDANDPPIATNPADGVTSTMEYDDDLTDGVGLDQTFSQHVAGLNLGAGATGAAVLSTSAAGDRTLKLVDGAGRTLRTVQLADDDSPLTQSTYSYGTVATIAGYGDVIETTVTNLLGEVTRVRTDAASRTLATIDPLGNVSTLVYDAGGNLLSVRDPEGVGADYVPDARGRDVTVTDTAGAVTTTVYDLGSNVVSHTDAEGETATAAFDVRGRRTSTIDRLGHVTSFTYDAAGDLLTLTDAEGGVTTFAYDAAGRVLSLTDPVGNVTANTLDALGRVLTETNEENATRSVTYDLLGAVASSTDRDGRLTTYDYDTARRPIAENWIDADGTTVLDAIVRTYDDASRLETIADGDSSLTYTRDDDGRIVAVAATATGSPSVALTQALDAAGRPTSRSASVNGAGDFLTSWLYDDAGRVTEVSQTSQAGGHAVAAKRTTLSYDLDGRLTTLSRFESLDASAPVADTVAVFDAADRLTNLDHTAPGGAALASYDWTYDADGRLTRTVSADGTADFGYDATDQLLSTDNTTLADEAYSYDLAGNRTLPGYATADANRLTADGTHTYEHDLEGNRTKRTTTAGGDVQELSWDHGGRLTAVAFRDAGGALQKSVAYTYDPYGRRTGKAVDADGDGAVDRGERYIWDGTGGFGHVNDVVLTYDLAGTLVRRTLVGPGADQLLAVEDGSGEVTWALGDHQGSVRDWAELAGGGTSVVDHLAFDSYGGILSQSDPTRGPPAYAYTGREWDADAELYYYRARWYDPVAGRFISEDPLGFGAGDVNLSRYVGNGTKFRQDPSGMWWWDGDWISHGVGGVCGFHGGDVAYAGLEGAGHGAAMVGNAATLQQIDSLSGYVDEVVEENGGLYGTANNAARLGVGSAYAAGGLILAAPSLPAGTGLFNLAGSPVAAGVVSAHQGAAAVAASPGAFYAAGYAGMGGGAATWVFTRDAEASLIVASGPFAIRQVLAAGRCPCPNSRRTSASANQLTGSVPAAGPPRRPLGLPGQNRPTWQQSEKDVAARLPGWQSQPSYIQGRPAQYGAKGSVRPDFAHPTKNMYLDVKNYDLTSSRNRYDLYRNLAAQARLRASNLPGGSIQGVVLDTRGQCIDPSVLQRVPSNVQQCTGGLIQAQDVVLFPW